MVKGKWKKNEPILVRVHSSCFTGDILGSLRCDCGDQLTDSIKMIEADMNAMIDLHYRLGLTCDLSQIPLAKNKRTCRNCGHRDTCPGGEDLNRARLEQSALEMAKSSMNRN